MQDGRVFLYADGGLLGRRNPCVEGVHWSVYADPPGHVVLREQSTAYHTNNEAEWLACAAALRWAALHCPGAAVTLRMDSRFVVNGFNGKWHIKILRMRRLLHQCRAAAAAIPDVVLEWRPRRELVKRVGH